MCEVDTFNFKTWVKYEFIDNAELIEDYHDRFMLLHGGYDE